MSAIIDVDRILEQFLRDRTGSAPAPGSSAVAADERPSPDPCPTWCRLTPGHPFLAELPGGLQSRYHESAVLAGCDLGDGRRLEARMLADEHRTVAGPTTLTPARIVVEGLALEGSEGLDPGQARAVAGVLTRAADLMQPPVLCVA